MDINLANAISSVRIAIREAANKSSIRRLQLYKDKISCKPGCSACCNRQVYITVAEAIIIQDYLEKSGSWAEVETRARDVLLISKNSSPLSWFKMNIMCPILDPVSRLCTAYETRPVPCSTHFAKSDPSQCDPWTIGIDNYESVDFNDLFESFQTALEKAVDGYGVLALKFPLPVSLIFASKIKTQSGLDPNGIMKLIYNELGQ